MNLDKRKPSHLHDVDSKSDVCSFAANRIRNRKCKYQPIGNKERKTANRKTDKKLFRVRNVTFTM